MCWAPSATSRVASTTSCAADAVARVIPGVTRFYLSLGDELMRRFSDVNLDKLLTRLKMPEDVPIEANVVTRAIKSAQTHVEQRNFETRKNVLKYDEVMNEQRKVIYAMRRRILEGEDLQQQVHNMLIDVVTAYVDGATAGGHRKSWDLERLWTALETLYPIGIEHHSLRLSASKADKLARHTLLDALIKDAERAFSRREAEFEELAGVGAMRQLERDVIFEVIDRSWREHLYEMDYLKEGIGLRALAQCDPLVEYQRGGYDMFLATVEAVKEQCVSSLFYAAIKAALARQATPIPAPLQIAEFNVAAVQSGEPAGVASDEGGH